jgi:hypothetical protein
MMLPQTIGSRVEIPSGDQALATLLVWYGFWPQAVSSTSTILRRDFLNPGFCRIDESGRVMRFPEPPCPPSIRKMRGLGD